MEEPLARQPAPAHAPHPPLEEYYHGEAERERFVRTVFDDTAVDYDRMERFMAFGSGSWYRRQALHRTGLQPGMDVLDVAVGTGLVARESLRILDGSGSLTGLDPSSGMLAEARTALQLRAVQGFAERLPCRDDRFDFVSMGYALRHLSDLAGVFREFHRVLRPGGRLCILEITRPAGRLSLWLLRTYMRRVVPLAARVIARQPNTSLLMRYYWDTIEACVPPEAVLETLRSVGFDPVERHVELGIFSEYLARKSRRR